MKLTKPLPFFVVFAPRLEAAIAVFHTSYLRWAIEA